MTTHIKWLAMSCPSGNGIELEAVGLQFEPYRWRPCGVTWDSSRTVVVIKLLRTSALASSTHDSPVQFRLPFKASKRTLEGVFIWLEQWAGATAYGCTSTASDYGVGWKSQRRGINYLGACPRHGISSSSTRVPASSRSSGSSNRWTSTRSIE